MTGGGSSRSCDSLVCFLYSQMAVKARAVKNRLKNKCCFQVICFSTPPQEHGSLGVKAIMYPIYIVNTLISTRELYKPNSLVLGKNNKSATAISTTGNAMATNEAMPEISGDLPSVPLKLL